MSFDVLAPHYRWLERVLAGEKLQRCRTAQLQSISAPRRVLILGEGNGRFLAAFCRRFPESDVTCVDASERMLKLAERGIRSDALSLSRVRFVHADVLGWSAPTTSFDLIVTHFFLDCFRADQLAQIVPMLAAAATPEASWLLADFRVATAGLARWRSLAILRIMYWFFRLVTRLPARGLTSPDPFLTDAGFRLMDRREMEWGLLHSDHWQR
jgi:SAM-dependent methyltransferase